MIQIVEDLSQCVPVRRACQTVGLSHHALYRSRKTGAAPGKPADTPGERWALNAEEKVEVRNTLNSERFADQAPREIYATLLDEGTYLCSVSSMYRIGSDPADDDDIRLQKQAGFQIEQMEKGYLAQFPKSASYCWWGIALRR